MTPLHDALKDRFPPAPATAGEWAPIYLEPIVGSGERLTVLVASRVESGEFSLLRTLDAQRAKCMYGDYAAAVTGLIDLIFESLQRTLADGLRLQDWSPPVQDAVKLGPISVALGDTATEIAQTGAMLTASLSVNVPLALSEESESAREDDGDDWERQIREGTVLLRQQFAPRFAKKVPLRRGAPNTRIGYLGDRLAAQFGRLIPGRNLTNSRNRAKAYVTDLQILRDRDGEMIGGVRPYYELMLWIPPTDSPAYGETQREEAQGAFAELEAFGDKHELSVQGLRDSAEAVRRILHAEEPSRAQ